MRPVEIRPTPHACVHASTRVNNKCQLEMMSNEMTTYARPKSLSRICPSGSNRKFCRRRVRV